MDTPLVSIIIPTYNRAHLLGETLDSVLAQTYQNWECIVVDDGSTDGTGVLMQEYMAKDARFQYHHRPKDRLPGGNAARNYGFEISKGDYIQWFDDDDVMLPQFLLFKVDSIGDKDLVICSYFYTDENLKNGDTINLSIETNLYKDYVLWRFKIITHSVLFKRTFFNSNNLYDPRILRGQETEFFSRIFFKMSEGNYKVVNKPLFLYRHHQHTKSTRNKTDNNGYLWSKSFISVENLKKGIDLYDEEIIKVYYYRLLSLFYKSIKQRDKKTSRLILNYLSPLFRDRSFLLYLEIFLIGNSLRFFPIGGFLFTQRWKKANLTVFKNP